MKNSNRYTKHTLSLDTEIVDINGNKIPVDCRINLPLIWGEKVEINLSIPHSKMPTPRLKNPCTLDANCKIMGQHIKLKKIWYRKIHTFVFPPKKLGNSNIALTHVDSLRITEKCVDIEDKLLVYISGSDFFDSFLSSEEDASNFIDQLAEFSCPDLGLIKLQRYWVKSKCKNSKNKYLLVSGYSFEIKCTGNDDVVTDVIKKIKHILDIVSIYLRQRIAVLGWENHHNNQRIRFWVNPLEPIITKYSGILPNKFLITSDKFEAQVNIAIKNFYCLEDSKRELIYYLSYSLSPAIQLRDEERFMSLFRGIETQASKISASKILNRDDKLLVSKFEELAKEFVHSNSNLYKRVQGFIKIIKKNKYSLRDKFTLILDNENVNYLDLWSIHGENSLSDIRNKLVHQGSYAINHQGLAVSTWHLSLLTERLVLSVLGVNLEKFILQQISNDEWAKRIYVNKLKNSIFTKDTI